MSTASNRLATFIKANKFIAVTLAVGIVSLAGIASVMAWSNDVPTASTSQTTKEQPKAAKPKATAETSAPREVVVPTDESAAGVGINSANSTTAAQPANNANIQTATAIITPSTGVTNSQPANTPGNSSPAPTTPATPTVPATPVVPTAPTPPVTPPTTPTVPVTPATPVAPVAGNLVLNPSVEDNTNNVPAAWSQAFSNGTYAATYDYLQSGHTGSHSLKVSLSSYTIGDAKWLTPAIAVTAGKTYAVSDYYQTDTAANEVIIYDGVTGNYLAVLGAPTVSAAWNQFSAQYTVPAGVTSIIMAHVIHGVGSLTTDDYAITETTTGGTVNPSPTPTSGPNFSRALISLTFDDGWKSIRTNGLGNGTTGLSKYGFKSTQYINSDPIEQGFSGYMTPTDIQDFAAAGHEIAWHTRNHADLATADVATRNSELTVPGSFVSTLMSLNVTMSKNFASPFGSYGTDGSVVAAIKANGWTSHRSVDEGYNTRTDIDATHTKLTTDNIKVQNILNTTTLAEVQGWVNDAVATNSWLVIVYHEVSDAPVDPDPTYSVTTANFDQQLNTIKASGVTVLTVEAALAELQPQL